MTEGTTSQPNGATATRTTPRKLAAKANTSQTSMPLRKGQGRFIATFLALPIGIYVWLVIMPFVQAFQISLTDWSGVSPSFNYIGFDNYARILSDDLRAIPGFTHTGIIFLVLPPIVIAMALFFAFMINVGGRTGGKITGVRGSAFYKVVYFFPQVLSLAIISIIWIQMYAPTTIGGIFTSGLSALGLPYPPNGFLQNQSLVLGCIIAVMVWGAVGFYLVYFSSAMATIPTELYEAAVIDGAGRFKTFFRVTLPLLWESVQTAWVYLGILALDGFVLVYIMTQGGPNHSSEVIGGVIYYYAFGDGAASGPGRGAGYASALGVVLFFVVLVITIVSLRITRREHVEH